MSSLSSTTITTTRKTRSTNLPSNSFDESIIFDEFHRNIHSSTDFINLYNHYKQFQTHQSTLIHILCQILTIENVDKQIHLFIFDCLINNYEYLFEIEFKQNILLFIKQFFTNNNNNNNELLLIIIRLLIKLIENRSNILNSTIAEWLSCLLNFLVNNLSSNTYLIYGDLIIDLFSNIIKQFTPLSKEIIDILGRLSITSINFLQQLKSWIKNPDDIHLALFSIKFWEFLSIILSRLLIRGHTKGNEILSVIEDAFIVSNYSIRSEAFTTWSNFMLHIHLLDDIDIQQLNTRLLKLFLTPFLSDTTSKSKSASISKCYSWITLIKIYPQNLSDIILPFLSFTFGNHLSLNTISTTTAWWSECRQIGGQFLYDFLIQNQHSEYIIKLAGDKILNYVFDFIIDQLLEYTIELNNQNIDNSLWLKIWNAYLNHLMNILKLNNNNTNQFSSINICLLTRIEQLWIDSRIETRFILKLFEIFEQIGFPLAIETVLRDSSIRTKTLSSAQQSDNHKIQEKSLYYRTTLSDQYLHMMLEHAIRFNDDDQINEELYLHVLTYLIDTLSKTSDENFCYQTNLLLLKCSVELLHQPLIIPNLFWHIWYRCSTYLINILNCSQKFELNNNIDKHKQDTSIELLLRPFEFNDIQRLDYSYTLLWIQLFKALCRLTLINNDNLINLIIELLRNEPAFEQAINNKYNQRLFGFILIIIKNLLKTFSDLDLSNDRLINPFSITQKRSLSLSSSINLCFTQFSIIINHILERLLSNNENNTQYILVYNCLVKSTTKILTIEQIKSFIFTYIRDLIIDLLNLCKIYSHLEISIKNLKQLIPFLYLYEQIINLNSSLIISSPISIGKQQIDNVILNKILTIIISVFEPSNSSLLLQLIYPILILAFQHNKTIIRNKARKCWNETFGRMTFIVYPNELRICLRDLKDKEHLLLPCFLADHDNSNTAGSGQPPSSTDESQLSQQIDIPTPLISTSIIINNQQKSALSSSPGKFLIPTPINRSINNIEQTEPIFVPIIKNQIDSSIVISKRLSSINSCLTEKQKEKLHTRHEIPLLCDDNSSTQSNSSCTINDKKRLINEIPLFKQSISNSIEKSESSIKITNNNEQNIPEETISIAKKLRRSCRSSMSGKKNLINKTRKKLSMSSKDEILSNSSNLLSNEQIQKPLIKGILKRLSSTKSRQENLRHVVFHDEVKVLVFSSPLRRDLITQQKKKSPNKDEIKSPTRIISKENLPLKKQSISARCLTVINTNETIIPPSPANYNKTRLSKLFHPNDELVDWTTHELSQNQILSDKKILESIFPSLIDCKKPIESLMNILYDGLCPTDILTYFHSNKINTIGDIARLTSIQIEDYPIPLPKLINIQKALEYFENSSSILSTNENTDISYIPITTTTNISKESDAMITNSQDKLYDVDTLIDSLDYEISLSTKQIDFKRSKRQLTLINREDNFSPQKRCLSPTIEDNKHEEQHHQTLGDRLQKAADIYKTTGKLLFDDDYIELIRQLFQNSSLTHLEQLHLKNLIS